MRSVHNRLHRLEICHAHSVTIPLPQQPPFLGHRHTDLIPKVRGLKHLDAEIILHLPHHFSSIIKCEMGVL